MNEKKTENKEFLRFDIVLQGPLAERFLRFKRDGNFDKNATLARKMIADQLDLIEKHANSQISDQALAG